MSPRVVAAGTFTVADLRDHVAEIEARAAEAGVHVTELYVPTAEPCLTEWCALHALHLVALGTPNMRGAPQLADKKFALYLASRGERMGPRVRGSR